MRKQNLMEAGLIAGIAVAVVAFGGTEPLSFAAVQVVVLGLACFLLVSERGSDRTGRFPMAVPGILLAVVLLELLPLPRWVLQALGDRSGSLGSAGPAAASVAPHQTQVEFLHWVTYAAAFYLASEVCRRREAMQRLVIALVILGSAEALYGVIEFLTGWQPLRRFVAIPRAYPVGTYVNRDHFAGLLEMVFPFALALAFARGEKAFGQAPQARGGWLRNVLLRPGLGPVVLWMFLSALLLLGIVCSLSRMGILSALVATAFVAFLLVTSGHGRRAGAMVLTGFLCVAVSLALWMGIEPVLDRYAEPMTGRLGIWADTLALIRQSPVVGIGLGTLGVAITPVQTVYLDKVIDHAHNDYLEFAAELGLPGALLLFAALFWVLGRTVGAIYRPGRGFPKAAATGAAGGLAAILTHSLADFNLHIPANALVFAVLLGVAWAVSSAGREEPHAHHEFARA